MRLSAVSKWNFSYITNETSPTMQTQMMTDIWSSNEMFDTKRQEWYMQVWLCMPSQNVMSSMVKWYINIFSTKIPTRPCSIQCDFILWQLSYLFIQRDMNEENQKSLEYHRKNEKREIPLLSLYKFKRIWRQYIQLLIYETFHDLSYK